MKLKFEQMPQELQDYYGRDSLHKVIKKGSSTIVVHTIDHKQDVWKKHGNGWKKESSRSPMPSTLFGYDIAPVVRKKSDGRRR